MKKILLIIAMCLSLNTFSQDFTYKIKINNVNNIEQAKAITDPIRFKFNSFPVFNDSTDTFIFNSNVNITQNDLIILLSNYGYELNKFIKSMRPEIIKEEEK